MNLKKQLLICCVAALTAAACTSRTVEADFDVIPVPVEVTLDETAPFILSSHSVIAYPEGDSVLMRQADFLADYIAGQAGFRPEVKAGAGDITLSTGLDDANAEAYTIDVDADGIAIAGAGSGGTFYGIQTLRKAIPATKADKVAVPAGHVYDAPRFPYRGAHLDVSRHFFPTDSVKEFIDMLALHNINNFHWHLTDHQGWRAEIKSRPRLTEVGSRRPHTIVGKSIATYDSVPVEGYYTQEQMRDIVRYAAERNINIIPEIDLPGHFLAGLAAYPELGCTGGPYEVYCGWAQAPLDVLCAGKPEVYDFLDDVFGELVDIFPSTLFHIGGDECPKEMWKECARCQALADSLGFRNDERGSREAKLQNHVMDHVARFLAERGRRVIGWDEVLDSDFADDAVVMSWRGESGGIRGAQLGHDVIMTPAVYLYFDFYQSTDMEAEPLAIGGYVPVEKVYGYDPVPASLDEEQRKHILGAQANLWTEYVPTFSHVLYMELPRIAALSEIQWSQPERKDLEGFVKRLPRMLDIYTKHGWPYAKHVFDVHGSLTPDSRNRSLKVALSTYDNAPVRYTLDGSEPSLDSPLFTDTLTFDTPVRLRAAAERDGVLGRVYEAGTMFSKATFRPTTIEPQPHPRYTYRGAEQLVDGCLATPGYTDENWLGFNCPRAQVTIDLEEPQELRSVKFRTNVNTDSWIFDARRVEVAVTDDGRNYRTVFVKELAPLEGNTSSIRRHEYAFDAVSARYVRLTLDTETVMPKWHPGAGNPAFLFIDEVGVY
ncbi:MAG: glycoside hydrolase family 20 protein [Muribaculaceae bacterium]|nr:glycoside hydrolase family 20 protein [Muribaculaceae bacterium]